MVALHGLIKQASSIEMWIKTDPSDDCGIAKVNFKQKHLLQQQ
jgi:hypothetical protein